METSKVSSKGQIVIPKVVRQELRLATGSRVGFEKAGKGYRLVSLGYEKKSTAKAGFGILRHAGKPLSVDAMHRAALKLAKRK